MEPFFNMNNQQRVKQITEELEKKVTNISPSDFHFFNIAHLPLIAKKTAEYSDTCEQCLSNLQTIETLVKEIPDCFSDDMKKRKSFGEKKEEIEAHLKKKHKLHFPGYFTALGSLSGTFTGLLLSLGLIFWGNKSFFDKVNLLTVAVFLFLGYTIGMIVDKKIFKKNMQL